MDPELERQRAELQARAQAEAEAGMAQQGISFPGMPSAATTRQERDAARWQESVRRLEQLTAQEQQRNQAPRAVQVGPAALGDLQYDQPSQQGFQTPGVLGPNAAIEVQRTRGSAGGNVPTATVVHGGVPGIEEYAQTLQPGNEAARNAVLHAGQVQSAQRMAEAKVYGPAAERERDIGERAASTGMDRLVENKNAYNRFLQASGSAGNMFIDPDRRTSAERVLGGIAGALGAFTSTPNAGIEQINNALERDVRAQMANQENAQALARNMGLAFGMSREAGQDERTVYAMLMANNQLNTANEIRRLGAMSESELVRDRAIVEAAKFENEAFETIGNVLARAAERTDRSFRYRPPSGPGVRLGYRMLDAQGQPTGAFIPGSEARSQLGVDIRSAPLADIRLTPSQTGGAPELTSGEQARLAQYGEARGAIEEGLANVNRMLTLVRQHGAPGAGMAIGRFPEFLLSTEGQEYRRLAANVLRSEAFRTGGKAFTPTERELVMNALGPLETGTPRQIETALGLLQQTYQNAGRRINQSVTPSVRAAYESGGMYNAAPETQTPGFMLNQGE